MASVVDHMTRPRLLSELLSLGLELRDGGLGGRDALGDGGALGRGGLALHLGEAAQVEIESKRRKQFRIC